MNIIQRLKNLWKLSEFEVPFIGEKPEIGTVVVNSLYKKPKMAEIIKMHPVDEVQEVLNEKPNE